MFLFIENDFKFFIISLTPLQSIIRLIILLHFFSSEKPVSSWRTAQLSCCVIQVAKVLPITEGKWPNLKEFCDWSVECQSKTFRD